MTSDYHHEAAIAPGVSAYYHIPSVWVATAPSDEEFVQAPIAQLIRDEISTALHHGIRARVRRDGLFVFDCTSWGLAGATEIPPYSTPASGGTVPGAVTRAEEAAEERATQRTLLMNAHQACLSSAHYAVHGRSCELGAMVLPSRSINLIDFLQNDLGSLGSHDPYHRYVQHLVGFTRGRRTPDLQRRSLLELDTVEYSFRLLDAVLRSGLDGHLQLVELLYRAGIQCSENRFAESLILSWAVCERLLDVLWERYMTRPRHVSSPLTSKRRKKLTGRDYTASVILEILELGDQLSPELFSAADRARQTRNSWLHSLAEVSPNNALFALNAAQDLMKAVTGVAITISVQWQSSHIGLPKRFFKPDGSADWDALRAAALSSSRTNG